MYPYGDYYLVFGFYELVGDTPTHHTDSQWYSDRLTAETNYHNKLSTYAAGVNVGTTMTTAGAILMKGNGAILAKETFYNVEAVNSAVESLMNNSEENN